LGTAGILSPFIALLGHEAEKQTRDTPTETSAKPADSRGHEVELALNLYNSAAQFNATCFVAVIFGQFAILTLLRDIPDLLFTWQVLCLIGVYILILILGCYLILDYLMFAQFIEELRKYAEIARLTTLEEDLTNSIERKNRWITIPGTKCLGLTWFRESRGSILRRQGVNLVACTAYLIASIVVLLAAN
jgi:hypothetical protein